MNAFDRILIAKAIKVETGCNIFEATQGLDKLLYALEYRPKVTDGQKVLKVEWVDKENN